MESYIIRIYRRDQDSAHSLVGKLEEPDSSEVGIFHNGNELLDLFDKGRKEKKAGSEERRSAGRLPLKLPVKVWGARSDGGEYSEETFLENISSEGICFSLEGELLTGEEVGVLIDPERSGFQKTGRVVRGSKKDGKNRFAVLFTADR